MEYQYLALAGHAWVLSSPVPRYDTRNAGDTRRRELPKVGCGPLAKNPAVSS